MFSGFIQSFSLATKTNAIQTEKLVAKTMQDSAPFGVITTVSTIPVAIINPKSMIGHIESTMFEAVYSFNTPKN